MQPKGGTEPPDLIWWHSHFHTPRGNSEHGSHPRSLGMVCERVERRETHRPNRERHRETHTEAFKPTQTDTGRDVGCD